jgi:hypothetical protein
MMTVAAWGYQSIAVAGRERRFHHKGTRTPRKMRPRSADVSFPRLRRAPRACREESRINERPSGDGQSFSPPSRHFQVILSHRRRACTEESQTTKCDLARSSARHATVRAIGTERIGGEHPRQEDPEAFSLERGKSLPRAKRRDGASARRMGGPLLTDFGLQRDG